MVNRTTSRMAIHYSDEWAALYVDGQLDTVGDAYLAEERAWELLAVDIEHDNAFLRGQTKHAGVAQTLDEVNAYRAGRDQRADAARLLREQADALIDQAERLERT